MKPFMKIKKLKSIILLFMLDYLTEDVLKSFPVIFDVEILLENWPTGQATIETSI